MKKLNKLFLIILLWTMACGLWTSSYAAVPHLISYQGRLTDTSGAPLNGLNNLTFRIYDAESAGNLLWQGTYSGVSVNKGIFNILLGDINDSGFDFSTLAFDKSYWLEIKVGTDDPMIPRQRITSAGYAISAETAEKAQNAVTSHQADLASNLNDASSLMPKGAIIMCKSACPSGYVRVTQLDGKFIIGGGTYNVSAGGNNSHSHNIPTHSHSLDSGIVNGITPGDATGMYVGNNGGYMRLKGYVIPSQPGSALKTATTLSEVTASGSVDSRPEFATVILCEKQ